jgi:predicted N-acetyltransferase YhbS
MNYVIRTVRSQEWDEFQRFLERCYGHRRGLFTSNYPELYRTDPDALSCFNVIEHNGKIAAHVGLFPMKLISFGAEVEAGGIGGVATLPELRGKGYMTVLLNHMVKAMKKRGWALSVLWGDRQRYYPFGWETGGLKYSLVITRRPLTKANVKPSRLEEVSAKEALPKIKKLEAQLSMRVERPRMLESLSKILLRNWIGDDGYVISRGSGFECPEILEVASETGREKELIMGVMDRCFEDSATVKINVFDRDRFERLFQVASEWTLEPEGQFRIIDAASLLKSFAKLIEMRAQSLREFQIAVGFKHASTVDVATLQLKSGNLRILEGKHSDDYVELDEREGVRLLLGPCFGVPASLEKISPLFPLPLHVSRIDEV